MSVVTSRQFNPEGMPLLPKMRLFAVKRPNGLDDVIVEGTGLRIEQEGVLIVTELVYAKNPATDDWEMLRFDRRGFRVWLDYEELIGGLPMLSSVN